MVPFFGCDNMKKYSFKLRVGSLALATIMSTSLASMARCEDMTYRINTNMYSITELLDALNDRDFEIYFERTNGSVTNLNSEINRFQSSLSVSYDRGQYSDDVREIARNEANASIFYISKQVVLNLLSDKFDTSMYSIKVSKKKFDGKNCYYVTYDNGLESGSFFIKPEFNYKDNVLYELIAYMEKAYNHKLTNIELEAMFLTIKDLMVNKQISIDYNNSSLGLELDSEKAFNVGRNLK